MIAEVGGAIFRTEVDHQGFIAVEHTPLSPTHRGHPVGRELKSICEKQKYWSVIETLSGNQLFADLRPFCCIESSRNEANQRGRHKADPLVLVGLYNFAPILSRVQRNVSVLIADALS